MVLLDEMKREMNKLETLFTSWKKIIINENTIREDLINYTT